MDVFHSSLHLSLILMGSLLVTLPNLLALLQLNWNKLQRLSYWGPDINQENLSSRVINGPFISLWLQNVSWGGEDLMVAPQAQFLDGYVDLIVVKNCPRLPLLSIMSEMNKGGHVKLPYVMYLENLIPEQNANKSFALELGPHVQEQEKGGIIDSDGEALARGKGTYQCDKKALMAYDKLK